MECIVEFWKSGKTDEREKFINQLIEMTPNVKFDVYGINRVNNQYGQILFINHYLDQKWVLI